MFMFEEPVDLSRRLTAACFVPLASAIRAACGGVVFDDTVLADFWCFILRLVSRFSLQALFCLFDDLMNGLGARDVAA